MKVPVAMSAERSDSVSCSAAGGGGKTYGKKKKPSATPNAVPIIPPRKKITMPRTKPRMFLSLDGGRLGGDCARRNRVEFGLSVGKPSRDPRLFSLRKRLA